MAESMGTPSHKRVKEQRMAAEKRTKQFSEVFYEDDGKLFCKFCSHCLDFTRIDTLNDHLKSKKCVLRKQAKLSKPSSSTRAAIASSRQVTLSTLVKAQDVGQ